MMKEEFWNNKLYKLLEKYDNHNGKFVKQILNNSTSAVVLTYSMVGDVLSTLCYQRKWFLSDEEKEDIVSSVFLKLVYGGLNNNIPLLDKFNKSKKKGLISFIFQVVDYEVGAFFKHKKRFVNLYSKSYYLGYFEQCFIDNFFNLDASLLLDGINSLRQRQVFLYFYVYGIPIKDIAEILGIGLKSVYSYKRRIINRLRKEFVNEQAS